MLTYLPQLLQHDPLKRLGFPDVRAHPWVVRYRKAEQAPAEEAEEA
jgi:hypothetical protein